MYPVASIAATVWKRHLSISRWELQFPGNA